jgi:hypothetical protein
MPIDQFSTWMIEYARGSAELSSPHGEAAWGDGDDAAPLGGVNQEVAAASVGISGDQS